MVLSADVLPQETQRVATGWTEALRNEFGEDLVSLFTYGSAVFGGWPANDFDSYAFLARPPERLERIDELSRELKDRFGVDLDAWFIDLEHARGGEDPAHVRGEPVDDAWALHRAHIHAGKFVLLHGEDPRSIVPVPTPQEIQRSLVAVLEDCTTTTYHGYGVLNLCRLWCSLELDDVVLSKRDALLWGLATLPDRWHPVLLESARWYARGQTEDNDLLTTEGPRFIEAHTPVVRSRLLGT